MKIEYSDQKYGDRVFDLDVGELTNKQAFVLQDYTGMSLSRWDELLDSEQDNPEWLKAITALFWLMLNQNGVIEPIRDVEFSLGRFAAGFTAALAAEAAANPEPEPEPDPTLPPGDSVSSPALSSLTSPPPEPPAGEGGASPDG